MTSTERPPILVLVGLMGSGKSTVARLIAGATGRTLVDTDELVERTEGRTVREIFALDGESRFRELESGALASALSVVPSVVAVAGGAVVSPANRELVEEKRRTGECVVVWLTAPVDVLVARSTGGVHRPLLDEGARGKLEAMENERLPVYAALADIVVDSTGDTPEGIAARIIEEVAELVGGPRG